MIGALIRWSVGNRVLVLMVAGLLTVWGGWSAVNTPLDAIPDLSDVQVIVRSTWPGASPQLVEDQLSYPLTTRMLAVPKARTVRGYSMFGESLVYVLFEDGTDLYWARSRVLEALSRVQTELPQASRSELGPDATGVGWIYEYALVDRSGTHDLAQLRELQDWFLKFELTTVKNVAEVATIGGFNRQVQITLRPDRLQAYGLSLDTVISAVQDANGEAGGSVVEMAEAEYMLRSRGYLQTLEEVRDIPVMADAAGTPVLLRELAWVENGPALRRGIAELDGEGEVVGGVVIMRYGENALETLQAVKRRIAELKPSLPAGVELVTTYDRSALITRAVDNLGHKLLEEFTVVALVCLVFLFHLRSALVAIITLPVGILIAFIVMHVQGVNANIMSLGGVAIAIGAMVDAAIVMIENAHKKLEHWQTEHPDQEPGTAEHRDLMIGAATEVGPALFFSLLIVTLSFVPVFSLQAQEGRLFAPLAYTKTWAMAAAAALSVTLIPVLMSLFIRGHIRAETANPLNRFLIRVYRPMINAVLSWPRMTLLFAVLAMLATVWPLRQLGSEFMPPLDEGDLLYMPTALPGLSVAKAGELLQQTDRIIRSFPEVRTVFGKVGRAESATDPAPLEMIETTIQLKPRSQWREGVSTESLVEEMNAALQIPGMGNVWVQPIRNRIDMLATGIKSPVGVKVAGPDLAVIAELTTRIEALLRGVPGTASVVAERVGGGRYLEIVPNRQAAARYGLSIADIQQLIAVAVGGQNISEFVEGRARFPINMRYPRELRDSPGDLRRLPIVSPRGQTLSLGDVAIIAIVDGPPMIKSENARLNGWVYVDIRDRDLGSYVAEARQLVAEDLQLPAGYSLTWSGQFEYLERASQRLQLVVPMTLAIIFLLLFMSFNSVGEALLIMATLPLALLGGVWLLFLLGHNLSVASVVGFIALAGVAAEFGVVMLIYLKQALVRARDQGLLNDETTLRAAIVEGAVLRVRPKAMTVAVIVAGLLPLFFGAGTGSELMQRIAAPMVGGMLSAPLLSMLVVPAAYLLMQRRQLATAAAKPSFDQQDEPA